MHLEGSCHCAEVSFSLTSAPPTLINPAIARSAARFNSSVTLKSPSPNGMNASG